MSPQALEDLRSRMQTQLLRGQEPRPFQLRLAQAQEEGQDAICQAATGQGKTVVASAPYVLEKNADRTTLVISPLIALQNEMVRLASRLPVLILTQFRFRLFRRNME